MPLQDAGSVADLSEENEALKRENRALRERLERMQDQALDEFFALAAHELRSPMHALGVTLDLILRRASNTADEVPSTWLVSRLERARALVNDLSGVVALAVDIGHARAGKLALDLTTVNLGEVVEDVAARFDRELTHSGCVLALQTSGALVGTWDRARLDVVVRNLLSNAIKFAPGKPIDVRIAGGREEVVLRVRDHGPGISREDQRLLFHRYERLAERGRTSGLGLGLWICRELVEAMGGTIGVESQPGRGATFQVSLPRFAAASAPAR